LNLWQRLATGLGEIGDLGDYAATDYALALFPPTHWQERPPLAYADAFTVQAAPFSARSDGSAAVGAPYESLARLLLSRTTVAGQHLGLGPALALAFGDAVAYVVTDVAAGMGTDFERGMAHRLFWEGRRRQSFGSPLAEHSWREARPAFRRVYEQFRTWQRGADTYANARAQWYRGLALEMGVPQSRF
jgi:hypothetical protein